MKSITHTLLVVVLLLFTSCDKQERLTTTDAPSSTSANKIEFYTDDVSTKVAMDLSSNSGNDHIIAFKDYNSVSSYVGTQASKEYSTVVLFDENYGGDENIFYYNVDNVTQTPTNVLISLEKIDDTQSYVNIYDYDWVTQSGKLIYKILYDSSKAANNSFEIILDYTSNPSLDGLPNNTSSSIVAFNTLRKNANARSGLTTLKSGSDSDGDSVFDLEEALDDALKTLSDLSETYLPLNIWKSLGTWIGNKSEIVYKKTIGNIVQGVGFVWETAHVTYETTKQDILQMKNKNTNYVSQSYSAQIVDFDEFEKMPESKRKKIEDYEDLKSEVVTNVLEEKIIQPEKCNAQTESGGFGTTITTHFLGLNSGKVEVEYNMYSIPDQMIIEYNGKVVASTGKQVSGTGVLSFEFLGNAPYDYKITVIGTDSGTQWDYVARCPR